VTVFAEIAELVLLFLLVLALIMCFAESSSVTHALMRHGLAAMVVEFK
jgi:hypothetical protein